MPVTVKKKSPVINSGTGTSKPKSTKTPVAKDAKGAKEIKSLESSLEKFHHQSDDDLTKFIEPHPGKEDNLTHRLDEEQKEARLVLMHRMLIRKVSTEEIRKTLKVGVAMYYKLKDQLDSRMRLDVSKIDVPYLIGDTLAFYDEIRSMALTMSSSSAIKDPRVKVSAMSVALKAEGDKNTFLTACGVYSAPVVEHIVRGMVSTGNFSVIDGQASRIVEAEEINFEMAMRLRQFAKQRSIPEATPLGPIEGGADA